MAARLAELIALAQEPSSARRRELLRELTDAFFMSEDAPRSPAELGLFDDVLEQLARDMETAVRAELSERMAAVAVPPPRLIRSLARDEAEAVAVPVLARSPALSETDLVEVAETRGPAHLLALTVRADLTERVTDAVVDRGDDATLKRLLENPSAPLSRRASEAAVDRALANPELHAAVVQRQSLPPDLLNEMYFVVERRLRDRILARNAELDPALLEAALRSGRARLAIQDGALPPDYARAEARVRALKASGGLGPPQLVAMVRHGERTEFLLALADAADIDFPTARRIIERKDLDALAVICKAANFDRALFLTLAVLLLDPGSAMGKAEEYGRLYAELSREAALRTLRFWRVRREGAALAA